MFRRVLVANRGEIAKRIITTLNKMGIESVAVYSEADKHEAYLKEATKSICIGPALAKKSYLNESAILEAAIQTHAEAIHPGFGFLSESPSFAYRCNDQKLTFIGPKPSIISTMGDKAKARACMKDLGIPTLLGSKDIVDHVSDAYELAENIGYPVLLKARSGGGGKGMRLVNNKDDLAKAFSEAQLEAQSSFNDSKLYLEKFINKARHIEFQILADNYGNVVVLGERECSVQRNNQKLIEEAPANNLDPVLRADITKTIRAAIKTIGYSNAGTMEFLLDDTGQLYFMEMNTRIQVEHPVTELITGIDIVYWQVKIAANQRLELMQEDIKFNGHAIECRINAEDPKQNFLPSPGTIKNISLPDNHINGPVRIDTHLVNGSKIPPYYDSMVAKIIVHQANRQQAVEKMMSTLNSIEIDGIKTNIDLQKNILMHKDFYHGAYDCSFISKNYSQLLKG